MELLLNWSRSCFSCGGVNLLLRSFYVGMSWFRMIGTTAEADGSKLICFASIFYFMKMPEVLVDHQMINSVSVLIRNLKLGKRGKKRQRTFYQHRKGTGKPKSAFSCDTKSYIFLNLTDGGRSRSAAFLYRKPDKTAQISCKYPKTRPHHFPLL